MPDSRHLHRHARDQPGVPRAHRVAVPGAGLRRGDRSPAQSRHVVNQAWPRRRAHDRPHQPLQHDVRSLLHGRQSGGLRPRADAGRSEAAARRRGEHQAAAADDRAVLGRRADDFADLPRRGALRRGRSATSACRRRPTASASRRNRSSHGRRARRACASRTCSSTACRSRRTRTARSAICSTSSCARSKTCTRPASTSAWWSRSSTRSTTSRSGRS